MLNQPAIFLGGQGGIIGPVRMGFGNVVAAGTVLRGDCIGDNRLIAGGTRSWGVKDYQPGLYPNLLRIVENNIIYLANLAALKEWYIHVRKPFLDAQEFGPLIHAGLLDKLSLGRKERLKRFEAMAKRASSTEPSGSEKTARMREELGSSLDKVQEIFEGDEAPNSKVKALREDFLRELEKTMRGGSTGYVETIQGLPARVSSMGTTWLECIVADCCRAVSDAMPGLALFQNLQM
jgi:UDP-N-acetylglucosamine/UDP-N-acetylgalactosamine diphosphorylase